MRKLAYVLPEAIERREVLRAARAQRVVREWRDIVGDVLADRSSPDSYVRGTLWISVAGSAWAHEMRLLAPQLLEKIAAASGDPQLVTELRFGVREPRERPPGMDTHHRRPPDPELEDLSIREIKEHRLKKWRDAEGAES